MNNVKRNDKYYVLMILNRLRGKFCKEVVRPTMIYRTECWTVEKKIKQKMIEVRIKTLRWIS